MRLICHNAYDLRYFGHHVHLSFVPALSIRKLRQPQDLVIAIADGDTNYLPVEHKTPSWRFTIAVLLHGVIASAFTVFSTILSAALVNGWMLGTFLFAFIWFEASPRAVVDRASRLFLSSLVILFMLYQSKQFSYNMFPDVGIFAVFVAPFVFLVSRWTMASFRTSLNAPDLQITAR